MSLRSWRGFLPQKTVLMVRPAAKSVALSSTPPEGVRVTQDSQGLLRASATSAPIEPKSVSQRLREGPSDRPLPSVEGSGFKDSSTSSSRASSASNSARVLVLLEAEPSVSDRAFLFKMLAAIQVAESQVVLEWGEFPQARPAVALGFGLSEKKDQRFHSFRQDRILLPSLTAIQTDLAIKRQVWETLKSIQVRLQILS